MRYALVLLPSIILRSVVCLECGHYDTRMGATFDITGLSRTLEQPSYIITDGVIPCTTTVQPNYTYIYNICNPLASGVSSSCTYLTDYSKAASVRIDVSDPTHESCEITGFYSESTMKIQLIDQEDPSKGISVIYYGDYCSNPTTQRRFIINLECEDRLSPVPTQAYEISHCVHTISMPSVYGCPTQCPVAERKLCAGNGHCYYDTDAATSRCFCNTGFFGADCAYTFDVHGAAGYSPAVLSLIITLVVIISGLVASIGLLYRQISAFRQDVENYRALKSDFSKDNF